MAFVRWQIDPSRGQRPAWTANSPRLRHTLPSQQKEHEDSAVHCEHGTELPDRIAGKQLILARKPLNTECKDT